MNTPDPKDPIDSSSKGVIFSALRRRGPRLGLPRRSVSLAIVLFVVIPLAVGCAIALRANDARALDATVLVADQFGRLVAAQVAVECWRRPGVEGAARVSSALLWAASQSDLFQSVRLLDDRGNEVFSWERGASVAGREYAPGTGRIERDSKLTVVHSIDQEEGVVKKVVVVLRLEDTWLRFSERRARADLTLLIFVGGAVLVSGMVGWRFRRRLSNLTDRMEAFGGAEIEATSASPKDDIGHLVAAFDRMAGRIVTRHHETRVEVDRSLALARDAEVMAQEAAAATRAKGVFLAIMSHELRTPMHGMLSYARFGIDRTGSVDDDKIRMYFERIHEAGGRLLELLNDLLDLSKLEAGRMDFDFSPSSIRALVGSMEDEFASLLSERGVGLAFTGDLEGKAVMDVGRIKQVLRNLVGNALKFAPEGSSITIDVQRSTSGVVFAIRDEGVGVPEDELEVIFDRFTQSSRKPSTVGGTGLGLAICREIVAGHGGRIWATNHPEGGAVFHFEIPAEGRPCLDAAACASREDRVRTPA